MNDIPAINKPRPSKKVENAEETNADFKKFEEDAVKFREDSLKRIEKLEKMLENQPEMEEIKPSQHQNPFEHIVSCPNCAENLKKRYEERQKSNYKCENCDEKVLETDKTCINCGENLDDNE